jgi:hypothetical protein
VRSDGTEKQYYSTATVLLHSRRMERRVLFPDSPSNAERDLANSAHRTCSRAARDLVQLLHLLSQYNLLGQVTSDVIHMLSLTTLVQGKYLYMILSYPQLSIRPTEILRWRVAPRLISTSVAFGCVSGRIPGPLPRRTSCSSRPSYKAGWFCRQFRPVLKPSCTPRSHSLAATRPV